MNFHGIAVRYAFEGADPIRGFFDPFGEATTTPDVTIDIRRVARVTPPDIEGWSPLFFYGRIQAYVGARGLLVTNDAGFATAFGSTIRIETSGTDELTEGLFHVALQWVLRARGFYDLHAAAVTTPGGRPIVFAGDSGAGKTTWMLAFVEAGLRYLGDDRLLLRGHHVFGYPRAFHVGAPTLAAFRRYATDDVLAEGKRRIAPSVAGFDAGGKPPAVLLFPRIVDAEHSSLRVLSEADAFGGLLVASAIVAVDGISQRDAHLRSLRDLVVTTRSYELTGGRDVLRDPIGVARRLHRELAL